MVWYDMVQYRVMSLPHGVLVLLSCISFPFLLPVRDPGPDAAYSHSASVGNLERERERKRERERERERRSHTVSHTLENEQEMCSDCRIGILTPLLHSTYNTTQHNTMPHSPLPRSAPLAECSSIVPRNVHCRVLASVLTG